MNANNKITPRKEETHIAVKATEARLAELHSAVADYLLDRINSGAPEAVDIANAIKFLKDNCIKVDTGHNKTAQEMTKALEGLPDNPEDLKKFMELNG